MAFLRAFPWLMRCLVGGTIACAALPNDDLAAVRPQSNVPTTVVRGGGERSGIIAGAFKKDALYSQILVAPEPNPDSALIVAPGVLTVDQTITLQRGADMDPPLPEELGLGDVSIVGGMPPLLVSSDRVEDLGTLMTLAIPLPLADGEGVDFGLGAGRVGIVYVRETADGSKAGLDVMESQGFDGAIARYAEGGLGWFRLVFLSQAAVSVEKDTDKRPIAADP